MTPGRDRDEDLLGGVALGVRRPRAAISPITDSTSAGLTATTTNDAFSTASDDRVDQHRIGVGQVLGALGNPLDHHQVFDLPARPQQTRQQCLADAAATDDRDSCHAGKHRRHRRATERQGTNANWRACTTRRPRLSTTVWSSSNQSCPISVQVAMMRSQPSAGRPRRNAVSWTVGAQPVRSTAKVTGADRSPHMSANSASGATPRGRAHIWITGGRPSARGAIVDSTGRTSQPSPRCTRPASGWPGPDRLDVVGAAPAPSGPPPGWPTAAALAPSGPPRVLGFAEVDHGVHRGAVALVELDVDHADPAAPLADRGHQLHLRRGRAPTGSLPTPRPAAGPVRARRALAGGAGGVGAQRQHRAAVHLGPDGPVLVELAFKDARGRPPATSLRSVNNALMLSGFSPGMVSAADACGQTAAIRRAWPRARWRNARWTSTPPG